MVDWEGGQFAPLYVCLFGEFWEVGFVIPYTIPENCLVFYKHTVCQLSQGYLVHTCKSEINFAILHFGGGSVCPPLCLFGW